MQYINKNIKILNKHIKIVWNENLELKKQNYYSTKKRLSFNINKVY